MKTKFFAVSAVALCLMAGGAQAGSTSTTVPMLLGVTSNNSGCSVLPSNAIFYLLSGRSTQGWKDWMTAAGFTQPSLTVANYFISGATYDQTVTINCAQPNTSITSILVAPAASTLSAGRTGIAYMLDDAGNQLAGGAALTAAELVSITSATGTQQTPFSFERIGYGTALAYTTPFLTSSKLDASGFSSASFVWHPSFWVSATTANPPLGNAVGGHFITPWTVTVNY